MCGRHGGAAEKAYKSDPERRKEKITRTRRQEETGEARKARAPRQTPAEMATTTKGDNTNNTSTPTALTTTDTTAVATKTMTTKTASG